MASLALGGLVVGVVWFSVLTVVIALQVLGGNEDGQADSYMAVFLRWCSSSSRLPSTSIGESSCRTS